MSELLKEALHDELAEKQAAEELLFDDIEEELSSSSRISIPDLSFLLAPTGAGPVESYIDHPLNYDNRKSTGRILRGFTGLCGALDYALIDITLGIIEKIQERNITKNEQSFKL